MGKMLKVEKELKKLAEKSKKIGLNRYAKYKILKNVNKDERKLTKEQKEEIKEFFKPYGKINTDFHEFYYQKTGKYYVEYLPDDLYYRDIDMYFNDWNKAVTMDNKCLYSRIFPGIKQPEIVVYRINGIWFDKDMNMLKKDEILNNAKEEKELFVKIATESQGGKGVYYIKDSDKSMQEQIEEIARKHKEDLVIQKAIKQHPELAKLSKTSVNTVRILSLLTEEGVKIYSAILRMGVKNAKVDNASSGGITCGIKEDGTLKDIAYFVNGTKYEEHPTSKVKFSSIKVPKFDEMKSLVEKIHLLIPHFRLASWDLAVDEKGNIILIEVNMKFGELDFHQLNNGPIFGDDTKKILDEVFKKI